MLIMLFPAWFGYLSMNINRVFVILHSENAVYIYLHVTVNYCTNLFSNLHRRIL